MEALTTDKPKLRAYRVVFIVITALIAFFLCVGYYLTTPPDGSFPKTFIVTPGSTVATIVHDAKEQSLVRSEFLLYVLMTVLHNPEGIYAGTYVFEQKARVFEVAQKLAKGDIEAELVTLTIPEGISRKEIAKIAATTLSAFDEREFLEQTRGLEGKLFPETYFISPTFSEEELASLLTSTFAEKTAAIDFTKSPLTKEEVLVLASVIEREANDSESMKMVSGILQNRLAQDMPLQADASIEYVLNKPLKELTPEDLKIDSPYNTYLYKGIPPTPIGNPGVASIEAVLSPTETDALFYITGNDGTFHYARTYSQHLDNIERYLR